MKLSVMIETYNHERFIAKAIDSVLAQSWFSDHSDYEIIVVDDQSSDGTPGIVKGYGDRLRLIEKPNGGQASAMICGLEACRGDIILMLDGDDWWHEDKVAKVVAEFDAYPECVAVGHGITVVDELHHSQEEQCAAGRLVLDLRTDAGVRPFHEHMNMLGTSRFALRRAMLDRIGRPPLEITYESDEYFFTLLPALGPVHVLPESLTFYRLHGANLYQSSNLLVGKADDAKLRKRGAIFRCLVTVLGRELVEHGIPAARAEAILEPLDIAAVRLELQTGGGSRAQTLAVERRSRDYLARRGIGTRALASAGVFCAAMLLPPRSFYALRDRYSGIRVKRATEPSPGFQTPAEKESS